MRHSLLVKRFRVDDLKRFRLALYDPADVAGFEKDEGGNLALAHIRRIADLQKRLYAAHNWSLLIILQGIDAAGKDSAIKHVMAGLNPQGCIVHPFKVPTADELDHDFLWRAVRRLPPRGDIGIFNRSYYEEVLTVRVHRELLKAQRLPPELTSRRIWKERFDDINAFERHLLRNGTVLLKFHLRISKREQKHRLLARLDDPTKRWKASMADVADRKLWGCYMTAYEDMIRNTSTREAPWYVVPADHKWFARLVMATVMVDVLDHLHLQFPKINPASLLQIRKALETN
jgi:PPK2 family polyphosphate:nucleotide phosphotransferase